MSPIKFLLIGLPRSGTTFVMHLINAHNELYCHGEAFNPYSIIATRGSKCDDEVKLVGRDREPDAFLREFYQSSDWNAYTAVGLKYMIGHHTAVLERLENDIRVIYVQRENKLAQISSLMIAARSSFWATTNKDDPRFENMQKLAVNPHRLVHKINEYETYDFLFQNWLNNRKNKVLSTTYTSMLSDKFSDKLFRFLEVQNNEEVTSDLVKQGSHNILDRFENPDEISDYFTSTGRESWLGDEI